jgi:hypothetical protein
MTRSHTLLTFSSHPSHAGFFAVAFQMSHTAEVRQKVLY